MKIAILYICTGRYNRFWKGFYESCEKFFLTEAHKEYFVFTDDLNLCKDEKVHIIEKQCEGFPLDSLLRFEMFKRIEGLLAEFDYIYFFNSNAEFRLPVGEEVLPVNTPSGLVGAIWPGHRKPCDHPMFFPYERNKKSTAYIAPCEGNYHYYMGGLNGGRADAYLAMISVLAANIRKDLDNGIIARVHDESHINKYFRQHLPMSLSAEYCIPEEVPHDFEAKMVFRDKVCLDPYFNKGRDWSKTGRVKKGIHVLWLALKWYL
jgi:hypothetical protein